MQRLLHRRVEWEEARATEREEVGEVDTTRAAQVQSLLKGGHCYTKPLVRLGSSLLYKHHEAQHSVSGSRGRVISSYMYHQSV